MRRDDAFQPLRGDIGIGEGGLSLSALPAPAAVRTAPDSGPGGLLEHQMTERAAADSVNQYGFTTTTTRRACRAMTAAAPGCEHTCLGHAER